MKTNLYHLQININSSSLAFYKELMAYLGWDALYETDDMAGFGNDGDTSLWFIPAIKQQNTDYDGYGVNHISLRVDTLSDVDKAKEYLNNKGITMLFDTPRHRPEFASQEDETYYQIMFESPDKILFEIVYVGKK